MKKKLAVTGVLALATSLLTACGGGSNNSWDELCVDPVTHWRLPWSMCQQYPNYIYYVHPGFSYPAIGSHTVINNYTVNNYHKPSSGTIHTAPLPTSAGKASKYSTGNTKVSTTKQSGAPKVSNKAPSFKKPSAPQPKSRTKH